MHVVIAGEMPFVEAIGQRSAQAGHDTHVFLVEDFLSAIESGYGLEELGPVDVAVEIHNESPAAKQELLLALDNAIPPGALRLSAALATSTTQAAAWTLHPEQVVGFSLMPPFGEGGTVELAPGLRTADVSLSAAARFWESLGYETVRVADGPGLIRARLVCCIVNEAASALMEGIATAEDIDEAMRLGTGYPLGPLEWGDLIGLDTVLGVMNGLFQEWGDDRYRPTPLLRRLVLAGRLGQKVGHGFFHYDDEGRRLDAP